MERDQMPLGFTVALSMNPDAMRKFATLGEVEKQSVIARTHEIKSKEEMKRYVDSLVHKE